MMLVELCMNPILVAHSNLRYFSSSDSLQVLA